MELELLLWRWSVGVQWASLAMITVFFAVLARTERGVPLRSWVAAWIFDLVALGVTFVYWYFQPEGRVFQTVAAMYMVAKTAFVLLFVQGAWALRHPVARGLTDGRAAAGLGLYALTATLLPSVLHLGVIQQLVTGLWFAVGGVLLLRRPRDSGFGWLGGAMLFRSFLSLLQSAVYVVAIVPDDVPPGVLYQARSLLSVSSFVDAGAEWLLALAAVLALSSRVQRVLERYNADLLAAQEELRRLADRDPLTGLDNRRCLPEIFRAVQPEGALLLFFDLDGFKAVNDRLGHQVGDDCLRRFAQGLRECFRPGDGLVRYAGDEFLVVAAGLDGVGARERVARLRERLGSAAAAGPLIEFSVGTAELPPGGQPEEALRAADESMYRAKDAVR
jgi:diguanylate cyclase (GGDEF)-like protein